MKLLHIIKEHTEPDFADTIIKDQQGIGHDVTIFRLWDKNSLTADGNHDYDKLVELIFSSDQVYTW